MSLEVYDEPSPAPYDDSPWTSAEMAILAGQAFARLDDDDYTHFVHESS
jgi:hypothetical protein